MLVLSLILLLLTNDLFVVDASSEATYSLDIPRDALHGYVDDIGHLARNMPGVVSVEDLGHNRYRYSTEKALPLSAPLRTDFIIARTAIGDSLTIYRSEDIGAENYMSCRVRIVPVEETRTSITITLRVRLTRRNPADVHWLAPILGEQFISERMTDDLEQMLQVFIKSSNAELYSYIQSKDLSH